MTTGLKEITANLNKEIKKIQGATLAGVRSASLLVQGEAMELTPVDQAVLINSAFSGAEMQGSKAVGRVGYTAKYAAWVHEMPGTLKGQPRAHFGITGNQSKFGPQQRIQFGGGSLKGRYWDGGEPKFLQKALANNRALILEVIQKHAKIK